ncbi:Calx-beta domain-containing protein [Candidatus Marithioploca araucensis]|uniref:Calx-beta domain-containing protein n=1 Tax=Candidatus Marithioploca araucensis TaxID=70273 RepID=A0ABT7VQN4_9GAMM|nr:Calx-beta domain-containing protein [Candidatus Marithioploca araucensis]
MKTRTPILVLAILLWLTRPAFAAYDLSWNTVEGGGERSTGGIYTLEGTVGQHDAGATSGGNYSLSGGFRLAVEHNLVINEIEYENKGLDTAEFVELKNISGATINFATTPFTLEFLQSDASVRKTITLNSGTVANNDYFVICNDNAKVPNCDQDEANADFLQNAVEAVALKSGSFIVDTVSYEGDVTGYVEGTAAGADSNTEALVSLSRFPDGTDTNNNNSDFALKCITPGGANNVEANDGCFELSINDPTAITEGDSGSQTINFTVSLSHAATSDVTVNYATADATATVGNNDYTVITATTLTFTAGQTSKTFGVNITGDDTDEIASETFKVNLSSPSSNAQLSATESEIEGIGTITDDDNPPTVTLGISGSSLDENAGVATITATLSNPSYQNVTANIAFSGTAIAGTDYSKSDSIVIAAGNTSNTMDITGTNDALDETNETAVVDITTVTNGTEHTTPQQVTATITDDDLPPTLLINDVSVAENTGLAAFTVSLSTASGLTVTVDYATSNGTATTADSDYVAVGSTTLTFTPSQTTKTVNVTVNGDSTYESDETFNVDLSSPSNATITDNQGTGTITNDDSPPTVSFTAASQSVAENTASTTITAALSAISGQDVTVPFTINGGSTATGSGTDYSISATPLTITAGNTSADITITINDDSIDEPDETVIVNMGSPTNATASGTVSHTVTIQDNDVSLVINEIDYEQPTPPLNDSAEFIEIKNISSATINLDPYTLVLYNEGSTNVNIDLPNIDLVAGDYYVICGNNATVANCDLDHTTNTNLIQNGPKDAVALKFGTFILDTVSYKGNATDASYVEGTGTGADSSTVALVGLSRYSDGTDTNDNNTDFKTKCITPGGANNVEANDGCFELSINDPTAITEGDSGTQTISFTVSLSHAATSDVTVNYATANDTATAGSDYTAITATTLTFAAGTNADKTFTVTISGNEIDEGTSEAFKVNLSNPSSNAQLSVIPGATEGVGTITDDDDAGFTLSKTSASVNESGTTDTFTVVLDSKPASNVEIAVNSADTGEATVYATPALPLIFTSGNWDTAQTVNVNGVDDVMGDGNQTTTVTLSIVDANSDDKYDPLTDKTVSVTTVDNDIPEITVNPTSLTVSEPSGTATFAITLNTKPSGTNNVQIPVTVTGACTISVTSPITIANGSWSTGETITVTAADDNVINAGGQRTCTIQTANSTSSDNDYNNKNPSNVMVTVQDDDTAGIDGADIGGSISITEGATGSYDIKLSSQPTGDVEMTVTADTQTEINKDGSTSFSNSVVLTFTNGDWNTAQTITVKAIDDTDIEGSHTSTISHAITGTVADTNYPLALALGDVTVNITDNDFAPPPPTSSPHRPKPTTRPLRIEMKGSGTGSVTSDPEGIDCSEEDDAVCRYTFKMNTEITLTPKAGPDSEFDHWSGDRDCSGGQFVLKQSWVGMLCYAYFRRIETPVTPSTSTLGAYYIPGAENSGKTYVRITNTTETPVEVKGTLYHQDGLLLGTAETVLFPQLAANATGVFTIASLAKQVGTTSWGQDIAWLDLTAPEDGLRVMNMYRNNTRTLANMSLVAENALYNLPGSGEADEGFALIINTADEPVSVTGTLYAQSGQVLGTPDAVLFDSLKAKAMGILSAPLLEQRVGTTPWQRAWLQITTPTANLKLMNINLNNGTILNMSHVVEDALYNLPGTLVTQDSVKVRFTNTTDEAIQVKGILYHREGQILGNADAVLIEELAPHATSELSMFDFEERFESEPWTSRARLVITEPTNGLKLMGLIRSKTGTVANASAVGKNRLFNVPPPGNFDKGWIRLINTTADTIPEIRSTLYHRDGQILGTANSVLIENLAADSSVAISQSMIAEAVGTEPWTARATLEITAPDTGVKLMEMIRSPSGALTNLSGALEK